MVIRQYHHLYTLSYDAADIVLSVACFILNPHPNTKIKIGQDISSQKIQEKEPMRLYDVLTKFAFQKQQSYNLNTSLFDIKTHLLNHNKIKDARLCNC